MSTDTDETWFEITFSAVDADDLQVLCRQVRIMELRTTPDDACEAAAWALLTWLTGPSVANPLSSVWTTQIGEHDDEVNALVAIHAPEDMAGVYAVAATRKVDATGSPASIEDVAYVNALLIPSMEPDA